MIVVLLLRMRMIVISMAVTRVIMLSVVVTRVVVVVVLFREQGRRKRVSRRSGALVEKSKKYSPNEPSSCRPERESEQRDRDHRASDHRGSESAKSGRVSGKNEEGEETRQS